MRLQKSRVPVERLGAVVSPALGARSRASSADESWDGCREANVGEGDSGGLWRLVCVRLRKQA